MTDRSFFKVILLGDLGIGKTSIIKRLVEDNFDSDNSNVRLNLDFVFKEFRINDGICGSSKIIKACIFDTFAQERFRNIGASFYRGANGVILAFDITNRNSFERCIHYWYREVESKTSLDNYQLYLVGTKLDLVDHGIKRQVSKEEAQSIANELGIQYLETSSKYNININQLFINHLYHLYQFNNNQNSNNNNNNNNNIKKCIIN